METVTDFIFLGSKIIADDHCSHEIKRCLLLGRKAMDSLDSILKSQRHYSADKGPSSQSYGFSSSHVCMWFGLDELQAGIKMAWRNINNLRYADDTTLMAKSEEEQKSLLMKVKEESEKASL